MDLLADLEGGPIDEATATSSTSSALDAHVGLQCLEPPLDLLDSLWTNDLEDVLALGCEVEDDEDVQQNRSSPQPPTKADG